MEIINGMRERKETWTRIEKGRKSVLDYVMIEEKESHKVTEIYIDEEKIWMLHYVTNEGNEKFTDRCAQLYVKSNGKTSTQIRKRMKKDG